MSFLVTPPALYSLQLGGKSPLSGTTGRLLVNVCIRRSSSRRRPQDLAEEIGAVCFHMCRIIVDVNRVPPFTFLD
ncbi:unnamed protein product [Amoebophrya sp. A25]|nr:unnamed protein product [Amoebophrya sp. A25]|eukprot:GSA25T00025115001.1